MARQMAVLVDTDGQGEFEFIQEKGPRDHHSLYLHAAKYGNGGFTGERCMTHTAGDYRGRRVFFRLKEHEDRFIETIRAVEWIDVRCTRAQRIEARFRLAKMNPDDSYFSFFFGSEGDVGVYPPGDPFHMVILVSRDMDPDKRPYLPIEVVKNGMIVRVTENDQRRKPPFPIGRAKVSANYLESNIAKHRAKLKGCHDAIVLDWTGERVSELSVSNLFLVEHERLITPFDDSTPLNGITKRTVVTMAEEMHGLKTFAESVPVGRLSGIRGAFATGTAVGIVKIHTIVDADGRIIWHQPRQDVLDFIDDLSRDYWRILRGEHAGYHPEWFTPVP